MARIARSRCRLIDTGVTHLRTCTTENGADRVLGDTRRFTDLVVRSAFEMIHSDDFGVTGGKFLQQPFDFLAILNSLFRSANQRRRLSHRRIGKLLSLRTLHDLVDHDSTRDHCEVSGKAALTAKVSKNGEIVAYEREEHLGTQVVAVIASQMNIPCGRRVVDNMHNQPEEAIDKILPRAWLALQASFQQIPIDFRECHRSNPRVF